MDTAPSMVTSVFWDTVWPKRWSRLTWKLVELPASTSSVWVGRWLWSKALRGM